MNMTRLARWGDAMKFKLIVQIVVLLAALAITGWVLWPWLFPQTPPEGILEGYGRIEGTEIVVSSRIAGRIAALEVAEGDSMKQGDLIAVIEARDLDARLEQAASRVKAAEKQAEQAAARLSVLDHHAAKARIDHQRYQALFREGALSTQQLDLSENALRQAEGEVRAAQALLAVAKAEVATARAARDEARAVWSEMRLNAPLTATVVTKAAERGELIFPGKPVVVLVDLTRLYLRVYLHERDIGKVKLGDPARVYVDSFPNRSFEAVVTEVAKKAEFTPKDVHMPDERVTLVYSVKLEIKNPEGVLKPGMPADAFIRWKPDAPWGR